MMVIGDICVKVYILLIVFMFKLGIFNNFVLLLDDKIVFLLSVVMFGLCCICKYKGVEKCYVRGE